jgi:haloalkane dehalogenase
MNVLPFDTSTLEVDGSRIAISDVGQGPVLLFVHTGFWSFIWRDVILRLADEFRCICFDAPGTGRSDRIPTTYIGLDRASRVVTALIQALELPDITLIVHDLGGPSGIAGAAPVADRIRALCAVNTFAWKPSGALFRGMLSFMGSRLIQELDASIGIIPRISTSSFGVARHMDESSRKMFLSGIGKEGIRSFHSYMRDALNADSIYTRVHDVLTGPFGKLPVVTIFGERNDPLGFQPRWKELFPHARQVVVPKGNHFPMCDDPDLVAAEIRALHVRC